MEILVKILNVIRNVIFVALLLLILWVSYNVYFDMIYSLLVGMTGLMVPSGLK